jgi:hypothetical protein
MKPSQLKEAVSKILLAKLVPMIAGEPGIGKSDIVRWIAEKFNLYVIDLRLSQCDPTDMLGFPYHDNNKMGYVPPEHFPIEGDEIPDGYSGWLIFLDEFNSAPLSVQAAGYKLVLDRQVGKHDLHKNVCIVCAGNQETDNGIVNRIATPMQSRLVHLSLQTDIEEWVEWASENKLDHRVISFVQGRPDLLHKFDPNHDDKTFACPRTWEFASKLIKDKPVEPLTLDILRGTISVGIATEFNTYLNNIGVLPTIQDIIAKPDEIEVPIEPALNYALSHMCAAYINDKNAGPLMRFIDRLPIEFGTISLQNALKRDRELIEVPKIREWAHGVAKDIFQ